MASLTIDPTRPPEKDNLIVILPDHSVIIVEAKALDYAQIQVTDITPPSCIRNFQAPWWDIVPQTRFAIRLESEATEYVLMKTGSLKRVMRYLEKRKKEKKKHV